MTGTGAGNGLKPFLAKAAMQVCALLFGGWWVAIKIIDWIGRLAVADAWRSVLKDLPEWVHLLAATSPWVPGAACLCLTAFLIAAGWPGRAPNADARAPAEPERQATKRGEAGLLSDLIVADGHGDRLPEFRGRYSRNGSQATFYLEYSAFHPNVMGRNGWTLPRKIEVFRQNRYSRGMAVAFPLVALRTVSGQPRWKLGVEANDADLIGPNVFYKCRVTALDAEDGEQHAYFIVWPVDRGAPTIIGQHMFDHILEWEGLPTRAGKPESLFE